MNSSKKASVMFLYSLILVLANGTCAAQQIEIVSPTSGTVVAPGEAITVQVSAPSGVFKAVQIIAGPEIGITPQLQQPPYVFSLTIPNGLIGQIKLTALGIISTDNGVASTPVLLDSETNAAISSVTADRHYYVLGYVGQQTRIQVTGTFSDGTSANLRSSSLVSYSSSDPAVATVDSTGLITGTGVGKTVITVTYGEQSTQVKVSVGGSVRGDLNGDGHVDQDDLNIILVALNTKATTPLDARDLNHDGVINALDARILTTLCTYPRCAMHQ